MADKKDKKLLLYKQMQKSKFKEPKWMDKKEFKKK